MTPTPSPEPAASPPATVEHVPAGLSKRHFFMVLLPVILAGCGAAAMWHFVKTAMLSNPILNGLILAVLAWGVVTMIGHVRRIQIEDRVFQRGMVWLQRGAISGEQNPKFGPHVFVTGMLERLQKLGLGHQLYIHSSAMEPEIESLEHSLLKRQDLSQFLVGLMVGLGLLGTFVGLLETLVETSKLIGDIANSVGGGGNMEENFSKIVGGLQKPLSAMGTAFSASMFGLVGSILLGFQMVAVRAATSAFVEDVRTEVLNLAERSKVSEKVEITERFLATLLADLLEQHRMTSTGLAQAVSRLDQLVPHVMAVARTSSELIGHVQAQDQTLGRVVSAVGSAALIVPVVKDLNQSVESVVKQVAQTNEGLGLVLPTVPKQQALMQDLQQSITLMTTFGEELSSLKLATAALKDDVKKQSALVQRMDTTLWNREKEALQQALNHTDTPPTKGA